MGTVKIKINQVGSPIIETEGFTGTACKDATEALEKALTGEMTKTVTDDKPELYDTGDGQVQKHSW